MKYLMQCVALIVLAVVVAATQSGCLVAAAAAGTGAAVAYVRGDLETTLDAAPPQIAAATEKAIQDMQLHPISSESTSVDGKFVARTASDTKIQITVKSITSTTSKISIRVGTFGDEALSMRILEQIKANLPPA
jgi:hypothetical protein